MILIMYLAVAVGAAYGLYRYFPNATRRWFYRIQAARKTIFTLFYLATTLVLLLSGVSYLIFAGIIMAGLAALQLLLEDPFGVF